MRGTPEFAAKYKMGKRLASGSFGVVFKASSREAGPVAVKVIQVPPQANEAEVAAEVEVMAVLRNPHVACMIEAFWTTNSLGNAELLLVGGGAH